tara:strand:- start:8296 stop:9669 length:1374 start_codon:yes stop_codon:yes gene_type:complete
VSNIPVAIIGGGISGLATAYDLQRQGKAFHLFESTNRLGGIIKTDSIKGFTIDGGPDSLLLQKPAAIELCKELGLEDQLISTLPPRTAYVVRNRKLYPLPSEAILGIPTSISSLVTHRLISPTGRFRMALEILTTLKKTGTAQGDESIAHFFRRHFGQECVDYIAEPLLAGIHAGSVDRLSMNSLFPRLVKAETDSGSILAALRTRKERPSPKGIFRSLKGGIEVLTRTLSSRLPSENIHTGSSVTKIYGKKPYQLTLSNGTTLMADSVVLAVPAYVAATILQTLDSSLSHLCNEIPYTSTATVALGYPAASITSPLIGTGFVVPRIEKEFALMAGSWVSSKWPNRSPDSSVLLRGFIGGVRNNSTLTEPDDRLIKIVQDDFSKLINISGQPVVSRVYHWRRLNPQHEVGHLERVQEIDRLLELHSGLYLIGAGVRGVGVPDCISHGRAVSSKITSK